MKVAQLALPDYHLKKEPDFNELGFQIEEKIGTEFPNQWLAMRGISLEEHPAKSREELEDLILEHGTDRYDPKRKSVHHEMDVEFGIELHAVPLRYEESFFCYHYQSKHRKGLRGLGGFLEDFYHGAKVDRGYPLRIDLLLFYRLDKLEVAPMKWSNGKAVKTFLFIDPIHVTYFRFKDPDKKQAALLGLLHLGK